MNGYNKDFLTGVTIELPGFSHQLNQQILKDNAKLRDGLIKDYIHYSVVMNKHINKRSPAFVALNIDQNLHKVVLSNSNWQDDDDIGDEHQLDNRYYKGTTNPWDRGHMAMRRTTAWGKTKQDAQRASDETFYYSNSCLQHKNLNRDEWKALEYWVFNLKQDSDGKITSFSGPIYGDHDRTIRPGNNPLALIPAGFFKVVCFINKDTHALDVRAFVMYQDVAALKDLKGGKQFNNQTYQVTMMEVEALTGVQFSSAIFEANPLFATNEGVDNNINLGTTPERHEVMGTEDIINTGQQRPTIKDDIVDVFIAAAMVNPRGRDRHNEWISIINFSGNAVDISGWTLEDNSAKKLNINDVLTDSAKRVLQPGESRVIGPLEPLMLSNIKDVIKLYDGDNARIDWVNYGEHMVKSGEPVLFLSPRDGLG